MHRPEIQKLNATEWVINFDIIFLIVCTNMHVHIGVVITLKWWHGMAQENVTESRNFEN